MPARIDHMQARLHQFAQPENDRVIPDVQLRHQFEIQRRDLVVVVGIWRIARGVGFAVA